MSSKREAIRIAGIDSAIAPLFVAATEEGIFRLEFVPRAQGIQRIRRDYPRALLVKSLPLERQLKRLARCLQSKQPLPDLKVVWEGTPFQEKVWDALCRIPWGETRSYADIARAIGRPKAVRAVGTAVGRNPIAILVPCHRVVRRGGGLGGYASGLRIKRRLLDAERRP